MVTKQTTKDAAAKPVAVSRNLLAEIANKETKAGKSKTPSVTLPGIDKLLKNCLRANEKIKTLKTAYSAAEAKLIPQILGEQLKLCQADKEFHGSVKVNDIATFVTQCKYSGFDANRKEEMVAELVAAFKVSAAEAARILEERTQEKMTVTLSDDELLNDTEVQEFLVNKFGKDKIKVSYVLKPTEKFHQDSYVAEYENTIMQTLKRFMKQAKPSIRALGGKEED